MCIQERCIKQQKEALLKERETSEKVAARVFAQVRMYTYVHVFVYAYVGNLM